MKIVACTLFAALAFAVSPAMADSTSNQRSVNPFTDCGIGAALFPTTNWAAVTSNVIWDYGTTAIVSATMSKDTCNGKAVAAAQFINESYDVLAEETAKGSGESLTTVLNILECDKANHSAAIAGTRGRLAGRVSQKTYEDMSHTSKASGYYDDVVSAAASSCAA